jgi:hypothetical protein
MDFLEKLDVDDALRAKLRELGSAGPLALLCQMQAAFEAFAAHVQLDDEGMRALGEKLANQLDPEESLLWAKWSGEEPVAFGSLGARMEPPPSSVG